MIANYSLAKYVTSILLYKRYNISGVGGPGYGPIHLYNIMECFTFFELNENNDIQIGSKNFILLLPFN